MGKKMVKHIHVKYNLYESKTWNCRFLKYARIVLALPNPSSYDPFLHSNKSSLEAHFSIMRSFDADTPLTYQSKIVTFNN